MLRVILIVILFGLINIYAAARIINRWPWAEHHAAGAWFLVLIFFLLQMMAPFGDRLFFEELRKRPHMAGLVPVLDLISYTAFGVMSLLVAYGLMIDLVSMVLQLTYKSFNPFAFDHGALYAIFAAIVITVIAGIINIRRGPRVKKVDIPLAHLPAAFDGFKIAQISDLHLGEAIRRDYAQNVVDMANSLKPDLVALTGDFVDGTVEELIDDAMPLSSLHAPEGVFFVTGNHEYYSGVHGWIEAFRKLGARVLLNEHVIIKRADEAFVLAGVTDFKADSIVPSHASDPVKALEGAPAGLVKILLAHQPGSYLKAAEAGFDLQLSGHTHGGQYFPFTFFVRFFHRYYKGLNRHENMWIYINRGTGYWGPPLRTGARSEITLITLRRQEPKQ